MCIDCFCNKTSVLKSFLQLSRLSGSFPGIPNFPGYPEIFWIIRKICSLSGNVSGYPETFQIIRKISSLSGKYPTYLETFQPIQKLSRLSRNFPGYPEIFWIIWKISSLSRNFQSRNFPKGPETPHCNFRGYAQKLSGRAKTFRMAMPPCHPGFWDSA